MVRISHSRSTNSNIALNASGAFCGCFLCVNFFHYIQFQVWNTIHDYFDEDFFFKKIKNFRVAKVEGRLFQVFGEIQFTPLES